MEHTMADTRFLTATAVLWRMRRGDLPTPRGAGGFFACFEDGALVKPQVMRKLEQAGKVERPSGGSLARPYTLTEAGQDASKPMDPWKTWKLVARNAIYDSNLDAAKAKASQWRDAYVTDFPGVDARVFRRNVKAGGVQVSVFVVVARRKPEGGK